MQPVALAGAAHHEQVAFTRREHDVVGAGAGRDPLDDVGSAPRGRSTNGRRWPEHHDGDERVVEPAHLAVAVQALEVVAVAVEQRAARR